MFRAEIEATNHCNTRCLHCPHEAISRPRGMMQWETFEAIVEQITRYTQGERFALSFSGMGEPLLNPLIYRFIEHVSPYAVTSFASNGSALTEQNVAKLIDAGLDTVYLSFNGDDPEVFAQMMGGLSYERVLGNMRRAVRLTNGTRLKILANVSITKANQDRISRIGAMLSEEGVGPVTYSLCHSRGGNLHDRMVCDTPPMPVERWGCDVMQNTLFVDWRGKAFICDHDLHGEYGLGDLMAEPLETVLDRRQKYLDDGLTFKICRGCNDIMRVGGSPPLESGAGGIFREWVLDLYRDNDDPLSEATEPFKWIYAIYEKEQRVNRLVNRLLAIEKTLQADKENLRQQLRGEAETERLSEELRVENEHLRRELAAERGGRLWPALRAARRLKARVSARLRSAGDLLRRPRSARPS